jgi:PAS domain S-box-containing protein
MTDPETQKHLTVPTPTNEAARLAALKRYKILDTSPEAAFDRITRLAARLFDMPIALISLVDESRAWFKSCVGFGASEVSRSNTLCSFAVLTDEPLIIPDARRDDRFAGNPFVQGEPGVRFYAGAPLLSHDGFNLGTLCLLDSQPRDPLTPAQQATLVDLAAMVVDELELRLAAQNVAQSEAKYRTLFDSIDEGFCICEMLFDEQGEPIDYRFLEVNSAFEQLSGLEQVTGKRMRELAPDHETYWFEIYGRVVQTGEPVRFENYASALNRWFNVNAFGIGEPQNHQFAALFTNITEAKQIEADRQQAEATLQQLSAELQSQVRKFDATLSTITDSVFSFDREGRFLYANQVLLDLWGITAAEAIGKTMADLNYPPTVEQQVLDDLRRVLETGESVRNETPYTNPAGVEGYFEYILSPLFAADRTVESVVGLSRDISHRKRVEAALRQSEEQSRNILESITDAFFGLDENWRFTYVNQTAYTLTGYEPGELIGKNFWETFPGLLDSQFEQMHRRVMRDRVAESLTEFYPDHDRWYEVRSYPATNGITIYFRNVTQQIKAEEAVRLSEARFRRIFECNMIGMGIWTRSGGIAEANDALLDMIGYTRQDLHEGRLHWQEITPPEHAELDQQAIAEIGRRGICSPYEKDFIHQQGHRVPILIGGAGFADNPEAGFFFAVDLSDRKQAEELLRQSESRLRLIIESAKDYAIFTLDLNGVVTTWNAGAERLLQYSEAEIVGHNSRIIFTPEDRAQGRAERELQIALTQGRAENERWHLRKDRSRFWGSGLVMPLQDEAGNVQGLVKIMQDKTTQRQAEAERERLLQQEQAARAEAQRANQVKDEFLAVLSHELRSPLNPILGWTQLLQKGKLDATRQQEALATIERNAKLQTQLIEDLLDISRIMQGKLSLTVSPVSLTFVIMAAVETVRLAAEAKNIQILLDLAAGSVAVAGDEARLQQVVWNLLTNAVKFTPNGGQVTIELRQRNQMAQIRVMDTGKGIEPQFLPHVFEYFRQADSTTTRKFGGLGLGLAIVRQITEMHGGTVWAESPGEGQGATFILQLPSIQPVALRGSEPTQTQQDGELPLADARVLLVDDEPDTRNFQTFLVERSGAQVVAVASGLEALQALEQFTPDVLVSDIGMAEMDGYMLMQQIRSRLPNQGGTIPAIALTAYARDLDQQQAIAAGFQMHLTKPVEPEQLISAIVSLFKNSRTSQR